MRKLRAFFLLVNVCAAVLCSAQPAANYYSATTLNGKNGRTLELALSGIIFPHDHISYDDHWSKYVITDPGPIDSIPAFYKGGKTDLVYDMYAWMGQFPKFYSDNDHSQTGGFNREHCVPNSWWGAKAGNADAYCDLHHLVPCDGAANNAKANYPLGEFESGMTLVWPNATKKPSTTSETLHSQDGTYVVKDTHVHTPGESCTANASHVWRVNKSANYGGATNLFEPADLYKGDFARMYLYIVCCYEGKLNWRSEWQFMFENDANNYTVIKDWALRLLLKWHRQDPVSDKERARNNAVESIQKNRNPFIDYPELVEYIWGDKSTSSFNLSKAISAYSDEYKNGNTGGGGTGDGGNEDVPVIPAEGVPAEAEPEYRDVECKAESKVFFYESFDTNTFLGGNDDSWSGNIASGTLSSDNEGWDFTKGSGASLCARFGTGKAAGVAVTPALGKSDLPEKVVLKFRAGAWQKDGTTLNVSVNNCTLSANSVTLVCGEFNDYQLVLTGANASTRITFSSASTSSNRFFLDEVSIESVSEGGESGTRKVLVGDVNMDKKVTVSDLASLILYLLDNEQECDTDAADVDNDGDIDDADALLLMNKLLRKK